MTLTAKTGKTMSAHCQHTDSCAEQSGSGAPGYRKVLWIALLVNAAMFGIEIAAGLSSGAVSLLADAIDFFGDAANYGVTIAVLGMGLVWRARAAALKAASMLVFGGVVLGRALWSMSQGVPPEAVTMGVGRWRWPNWRGDALCVRAGRQCAECVMHPATATSR
jgi:Co/Zn/Cd efflux system component